MYWRVTQTTLISLWVGLSMQHETTLQWKFLVRPRYTHCHYIRHALGYKYGVYRNLELVFISFIHHQHERKSEVKTSLL